MVNIFSAFRNFVKLSQDVLSSAAENGVILGETADIHARIKKIEKELIEITQLETGEKDLVKALDRMNVKTFSRLVRLLEEKKALEDKLVGLDTLISERMKSSQVTHDSMVAQISEDLDFERLSDSFAKSITPILQFLSSTLEQAYDKYSGRQFHYSKAYADSFHLSDDDKTRIGDAFELFLGRHYEKLGFPVLFNGIVKRTRDQGIDLIVFNRQTNSAKYIQVKNWYQRKFDITELDKVYNKLNITPVTYFDPELELQNRLTSFQGTSSVNFASLINELPNMSIEKVLYLPSRNNITNDVARFFEEGEYKDMKLKFHNQKFKNAFGSTYR